MAHLNRLPFSVPQGLGQHLPVLGPQIPYFGYIFKTRTSSSLPSYPIPSFSQTQMSRTTAFDFLSTEISQRGGYRDRGSPQTSLRVPTKYHSPAHDTYRVRTDSKMGAYPQSPSGMTSALPPTTVFDVLRRIHQELRTEIMPDEWNGLRRQQKRTPVVGSYKERCGLTSTGDNDVNHLRERKTRVDCLGEDLMFGGLA